MGGAPDGRGQDRVFIRDASQLGPSGGARPGPTSEELAELQELRREVTELQRANAILRQASAYFAAAELDRQRK